MILVLQGADFSENNLGQVEVTTELDDFTLLAIERSGNESMSELQKSALNTFFKEVGAFGDANNIWSKIDMAYMPLICADLAHAGIDYQKDHNDNDLTLSSSLYQLRNHGITGLNASPSSSEDTGTTLPTSYVFDKTSMSVVALCTEDISSEMSRVYMLTYQGNSGSNRFTMSCGKNTVGDHKQYLTYISPSVEWISSGNEKNKAGGFSISSSSRISIQSNDGGVVNAPSAYETAYSNIGTDSVNTNFKLFKNGSTPNPSGSQAVGLVFIGKYLTSEELVTLRNASDKLADIFNP